VAYRHPLIVHRNTRYRFPDPLFQRVPTNLQAPLLPKVGEYYRVMGDQKSFDISFRKMDVEPCRAYLSHHLWERALDMTHHTYGSTFNEIRDYMISSTEEVMESMVMDKASGLPWSLHGLRTKESCFKNAAFRSYVANWPDMIEPVWKVIDKIEWYHITDLDSNKVRTFIIPPADFLFYQKVLYLKQNEAMKMKHTSSYGFNPYGGGTNILALRLLRNKVFFMYDVKGYDRKCPLMRECYDLRNAFAPPELIELATWVADNTVVSLLIHPDGTIVLKAIGNNSGSGNTTTDNILTHDMMGNLYSLSLVEPHFEDVSLVYRQIFGDDCVGSVPLEYEHKIREVLVSSFALFGYELDPIVVSQDLRDMEFLGFNFGFRDGFWIPVYKQERLLASFCYEIQNKRPSASLCKAYSLTVMAFGGDLDTFNEMRAVLGYHLEYYRNSHDPIIQAFVAMGVPSYSDCFSFFTGLESCTFTAEVVGGIKNFIDEYQCQKF